MLAFSDKLCYTMERKWKGSSLLKRYKIKSIAVFLLYCAMLSGCNLVEPVDENSLSPMPTNTAFSEHSALEDELNAATSTTVKRDVPTTMLIHNVPFQSQIGVLPTGCELFSALMVLNYYDVGATIEDVIEKTKSEYPEKIGEKVCAPKPTEAFIGAPDDKTSFGCYPPVVVDMMSKLLPESLTAVDTTGMELKELAETYLPLERPILVWATIDMEESYRKIGWYLKDADGNPTDEWYFWNAPEHCLVLIGYNENYYFFNDPLSEGSPTPFERKLVEQRFGELGKMSVVVCPTSEVQAET